MTLANTAEAVEAPQIMEVGKTCGNENRELWRAWREKSLEAGASSVGSKRGHRSKYIVEEDVIILREGAAAKGHIHPCGSTLELFQAADENINENSKLIVEGTTKGSFYINTRLQEDIEKKLSKNFCTPVLEGR